MLGGGWIFSAEVAAVAAPTDQRDGSFNLFTVALSLNKYTPPDKLVIAKSLLFWAMHNFPPFAMARGSICFCY